MQQIMLENDYDEAKDQAALPSASRRLSLDERRILVQSDAIGALKKVLTHGPVASKKRNKEPIMKIPESRKPKEHKNSISPAADLEDVGMDPHVTHRLDPIDETTSSPESTNDPDYEFQRELVNTLRSKAQISDVQEPGKWNNTTTNKCPVLSMLQKRNPRRPKAVFKTRKTGISWPPGLNSEQNEGKIEEAVEEMLDPLPDNIPEPRKSKSIRSDPPVIAKADAPSNHQHENDSLDDLPLSVVMIPSSSRVTADDVNQIKDTQRASTQPRVIMKSGLSDVDMPVHSEHDFELLTADAARNLVEINHPTISGNTRDEDIQDKEVGSTSQQFKNIKSVAFLENLLESNSVETKTSKEALVCLAGFLSTLSTKQRSKFSSLFGEVYEIPAEKLNRVDTTTFTNTSRKLTTYAPALPYSRSREANDNMTDPILSLLQMRNNSNTNKNPSVQVEMKSPSYDASHNPPLNFENFNDNNRHNQGSAMVPADFDPLALKERKAMLERDFSVSKIKKNLGHGPSTLNEDPILAVLHKKFPPIPRKPEVSPTLCYDGESQKASLYEYNSYEPPACPRNIIIGTAEEALTHSKPDTKGSNRDEIIYALQKKIIENNPIEENSFPRETLPKSDEFQTMDDESHLHYRSVNLLPIIEPSNRKHNEEKQDPPNIQIQNHGRKKEDPPATFDPPANFDPLAVAERTALYKQNAVCTIKKVLIHGHSDPKEEPILAALHQKFPPVSHEPKQSSNLSNKNDLETKNNFISKKIIGNYKSETEYNSTPTKKVFINDSDEVALPTPTVEQEAQNLPEPKKKILNNLPQYNHFEEGGPRSSQNVPKTQSYVKQRIQIHNKRPQLEPPDGTFLPDPPSTDEHLQSPISQEFGTKKHELNVNDKKLCVVEQKDLLENNMSCNKAKKDPILTKLQQINPPPWSKRKPKNVLEIEDYTQLQRPSQVQLRKSSFKDTAMSSKERNESDLMILSTLENILSTIEQKLPLSSKNYESEDKHRNSQTSVNTDNKAIDVGQSAAVETDNLQNQNDKTEEYQVGLSHPAVSADSDAVGSRQPSGVETSDFEYADDEAEEAQNGLPYTAINTESKARGVMQSAGMESGDMHEIKADMDQGGLQDDFDPLAVVERTALVHTDAVIHMKNVLVHGHHEAKKDPILSKLQQIVPPAWSTEKSKKNQNQKIIPSAANSEDRSYFDILSELENILTTIEQKVPQSQGTKIVPKIDVPYSNGRGYLEKHPIDYSLDPPFQERKAILGKALEGIDSLILFREPRLPTKKLGAYPYSTDCEKGGGGNKTDKTISETDWNDNNKKWKKSAGLINIDKLSLKQKKDLLKRIALDSMKKVLGDAKGNPTVYTEKDFDEDAKRILELETIIKYLQDQLKDDWTDTNNEITQWREVYESLVRKNIKLFEGNEQLSSLLPFFYNLAVDVQNLNEDQSDIDAKLSRLIEVVEDETIMKNHNIAPTISSKQKKKKKKKMKGNKKTATTTESYNPSTQQPLQQHQQQQQRRNKEPPSSAQQRRKEIRKKRARNLMKDYWR